MTNMLTQNVLLLIPFTMYLVCRTEGCGKLDWRNVQRSWLEEEWTGLTDKRMTSEARDEFIELIYSRKEYHKLIKELDEYMSTIAQEVAKLEQEIQEEAGKSLTFKQYFIMMQDDFTKFFELLPEKLKKKAPTDVKNLQVLLALLPANDDIFADKLTKSTLERWKKFADAMKLVQSHINSYVQEKKLKWLQEQKNKLNWWIDFFSARLLKKESTVGDRDTGSSSGTGSANKGTSDVKTKAVTRSKIPLVNALHDLFAS